MWVRLYGCTRLMGHIVNERFSRFENANSVLRVPDWCIITLRFTLKCSSCLVPVNLKLTTVYYYTTITLNNFTDNTPEEGAYIEKPLQTILFEV